MRLKDYSEKEKAWIYWWQWLETQNQPNRDLAASHLTGVWGIYKHHRIMIGSLASYFRCAFCSWFSQNTCQFNVLTYFSRLLEKGTATESQQPVEVVVLPFGKPHSSCSCHYRLFKLVSPQCMLGLKRDSTGQMRAHQMLMHAFISSVEQLRI